MTKLGEKTKHYTARASEQAWRQPFLDALVDTSNVSAAAKKAGISTSHVYRTRREDDSFARAWYEALEEGYANLEMDLLYRMRHGELSPAAGSKKRTRKFDNAVALRLLAAHRETAAQQRAARDNVSALQMREAIERKVQALREQAKSQRGNA